MSNYGGKKTEYTPAEIFIIIGIVLMCTGVGAFVGIVFIIIGAVLDQKAKQNKDNPVKTNTIKMDNEVKIKNTSDNGLDFNFQNSAIHKGIFDEFEDGPIKYK